MRIESAKQKGKAECGSEASDELKSVMLGRLNAKAKKIFKHIRMDLSIPRPQRNPLVPEARSNPNYSFFNLSA